MSHHYCAQVGGLVDGPRCDGELEIEFLTEEVERGLVRLEVLPEQAAILNQMLHQRGFQLSPAVASAEDEVPWRVLTFIVPDGGGL